MRVKNLGPTKCFYGKPSKGVMEKRVRVGEVFSIFDPEKDFSEKYMCVVDSNGFEVRDEDGEPIHPKKFKKTKDGKFIIPKGVEPKPEVDDDTAQGDEDSVQVENGPGDAGNISSATAKTAESKSSSTSSNQKVI